MEYLDLVYNRCLYAAGVLYMREVILQNSDIASVYIKDDHLYIQYTRNTLQDRLRVTNTILTSVERNLKRSIPYSFRVIKTSHGCNRDGEKIWALFCKGKLVNFKSEFKCRKRSFETHNSEFVICHDGGTAQKRQKREKEPRPPRQQYNEYQEPIGYIPFEPKDQLKDLFGIVL